MEEEQGAVRAAKAGGSGRLPGARQQWRRGRLG
jgi:hypothetical protein